MKYLESVPPKNGDTGVHPAPIPTLLFQQMWHRVVDPVDVAQHILWEGFPAVWSLTAEITG